MTRRLVGGGLLATVLAGGILFAPQAAQAQGLYVPPAAAIDVSQLATKVEVAAAKAAADGAANAAAAACPPGSIMPQSEAVLASAGSASTCLRSDAKLPRITRAGMASSTTTTGEWSITWSTPLPAAPVTLPIPMNTGTQPIVCNVSSSTAIGASGRCWLARTLPATLLTLTALLSFDPNGAPAAGIQVQVLAIPTTQ